MIDQPTTEDQRRIRRVALGDFVHRSALRFAERTAVVDGDTRLSYAELDARSSRLAHHLLGTVGSGKQIGMLCQNSADMVVAYNGIHKSGNVGAGQHPAGRRRHRIRPQACRGVGGGGGRGPARRPGAGRGAGAAGRAADPDDEHRRRRAMRACARWRRPRRARQHAARGGDRQRPARAHHVHQRHHRQPQGRGALARLGGGGADGQPGGPCHHRARRVLGRAAAVPLRPALPGGHRAHRRRLRGAAARLRARRGARVDAPGALHRLRRPADDARCWPTRLFAWKACAWPSTPWRPFPSRSSGRSPSA
jgi:hypothetical protein